MSGISVANNLDVKGSVAGVTMKDFITSDTHQVFDGTTTLQGNIILGNVTLGGLWNGVNISSSSDSKLSSFLIRDLRHLSQTELVVDKLRVTETFNGAPVSELVYTNNDVISVRQLAAATADVTEDISVVGKFGFRSKKGTSLAISEYLKSCIYGLDSKNKVIGAFYDMSKAFDTISHDKLLYKLKFYGFDSL
ncbi:hypothetical protein J6590_006984 [Homalodisca vitripennis]|nr:hypothetical protein J6590_006984 [Homalodisca vitripennis]